MKKLLLLLLISVTSITANAGVWSFIKNLVGTAATVEFCYIGAKTADYFGIIDLDEIMSHVPKIHITW